MNCINRCLSPIGDIWITADDGGITGICLASQRYFDVYRDAEFAGSENLHIARAVEWLDLYFSGKVPSFMPSLSLSGTDFQKSVWNKLLNIPYGKTVSYGDIAKQIAIERGISRMSAQAVGSAVGKNPIAIIVPCHRVIGADGNLVGYAAGIDKKRALLKIEGITV